jgi:hypothetical protein
MMRLRCLGVAAALVCLLGCSKRFGPDGMPSDMQGVWTLYAPFYGNDNAKIKFSGGRFHVSGRTQMDDASTMEIDGTYHFVGKSLRLTFDNVVATISPRADKVPRDQIQGDVDTLRQIKSLDFQVVPMGDGVLELLAPKNGGSGQGNVDFTLDWGEHAGSMGVSTSMGWLADLGSGSGAATNPNGSAIIPIVSHNSRPAGNPPAAPQGQDQPAAPDQPQQLAQTTDQTEDQSQSQPNGEEPNPQEPPAQPPQPGEQTSGSQSQSETGQ